MTGTAPAGAVGITGPNLPVEADVRNIESSMRSFLTDTFGPRATFDEMERKVYGHDIGSIPSMIKPFLGRTAPTPWSSPRPPRSCRSSRRGRTA